MAGLSLRQICKTYDNGFEAIKNISLDAEDGELIVLAGPAGSGKTTILNLIAGLESITEGEIYIEDLCVNDTASKYRDVGLISSGYTMYPGLSVYDNIAFGLKLNRISKEEIDQRVREAARILEIEGILDAVGEELTQRQQRMVSMARAVAKKPKILLMDEPFTGLPEELRSEFIKEVPKLCEKLGVSLIYASGSQEEIVGLESRTIILKEGEIQQIGYPEEIYNHPANLFSADFLGEPSINLVHGQAIKKDGNMCLQAFHQNINLTGAVSEKLEGKGYINKKVILGIRPDNIEVKEEYLALHPQYVMEGIVKEILNDGSWMIVDADKIKFTLPVTKEKPVGTGERIRFAFEEDKVRIFDAATEKTLI